MLKELLESKKCFKLICGAGNENLAEVEKLVALYAKAGCHFFDFAASEGVLKAAQRGLDFAIPKEEQKNYHFCVSIGTKDDQHIQKARIDVQKCNGCGKCVRICPQKAVKIRCEDAKMCRCVEIIKENCIGCMKCQNICESDAIKQDRCEDAKMRRCIESATLLHLHASTPLSCIELHASDADENEVDEIWDYLNKNFDGMLSICMGRSKLSNEQILSRLKRLIKDRKPYTTIVQADGSPMSGGEDDFKTTLQAVAMAEIIQNENLPVYLLLSGGTNSKTAELAKLCGVNFHGIAVGSYARKIVKPYIEMETFLSNSPESKANFENAFSIVDGLIVYKI